MAEKSIDFSITNFKEAMSITTHSSAALTNDVRLIWDDTLVAGDLMSALKRVTEKAQEYMQSK